MNHQYEHEVEKLKEFLEIKLTEIDEWKIKYQEMEEAFTTKEGY